MIAAAAAPAPVLAHRSRASVDPALALILSQRDDCHLCDLALGVLAEARVPDFESVFIDGDPALEAAYGERVPVLREASGRELGWPFDAAAVAAFLSRGGARPQRAASSSIRPSTPSPIIEAQAVLPKSARLSVAVAEKPTVRRNGGIGCRPSWLRTASRMTSRRVPRSSSVPWMRARVASTGSTRVERKVATGCRPESSSPAAA